VAIPFISLTSGDLAECATRWVTLKPEIFPTLQGFCRAESKWNESSAGNVYEWDRQSTCSEPPFFENSR
jgi:hypothetical protein